MSYFGDSGRYRMKKILILSIFGLLVSACATHGLNVKQVNKKLTYQFAMDYFDDMKGQTALWTGQIISGKNFKDSSEIEILAFPQNDYGEPIKDAQSYGRFLAVKQGYLELGEYAKDRWVTLVGTLDSKRKGKVGDSDYIYPVLKVQQIKVWPIEQPYYYDDSDVRFHFGIGVFHRF